MAAPGVIAPALPRAAAVPRWPVPVLLFSLQIGGFNVPFSGRDPVLLVFDLALLPVLAFLAGECALGSLWPDLSDRAVLLPMSLCVVAQLLSSLANPGDIFKSLVAIKVFVCGALLYVLAVSFSTTVSLARSLVLFGGVTGISLLYGFVTSWQGILAGEGARDLKNLVELPMGLHNYLAAMLVLLLPLAVGYARTAAGRWRAASYAAAAAMAVGLLITMSRGAFASLLTASLVSTPLMLRAGLRLRHMACAAILLALAVPFVPREVFQANTYLLEERLEHNDVDREAIYRLAWRAFAENPLLGVGPGQIVDLTAELSINNQRLTAHNLVLNSLAELGLLGAIPYLLWIAVLLRRAWLLAYRHRAPFSVGLWVGLLATLLANLVDDPFAGQHYLVLFCVTGALATRLFRCLPSSPGTAA